MGITIAEGGQESRPWVLLSGPENPQRWGCGHGPVGGDDGKETRGVRAKGEARGLLSK